MTTEERVEGIAHTRALLKAAAAELDSLKPLPSNLDLEAEARIGMADALLLGAEKTLQRTLEQRRTLAAA